MSIDSINYLKGRRIVYIFFLVLAIDILGVLLREDAIRFFAKPLIVLSLMVYVWVNRKRVQAAFMQLLMGALFFSWLGDVFLQLEKFTASFFLIGLSAFLIAHVFYIILFNKIFKREKGSLKVFLIIPAIIYYVSLILFLLPGLGGMTIPVLVYGLVITIMLIIAVHIYFRTNSPSGMYIAIGAILFVVSDSLLAINKFHTAFAYAGVFIMLTYGLAEYFIVRGICSYQQKVNTSSANP